jgi:CHAT domain-containing protein
MHAHAADALAALESVRLRVASPTLRASFFASARDARDLDIEALMHLHAARPGEGFGAAALEASERGKARSLLELLGENGAEIRRGVDAALLDRERELERLISAKANQQMRLLAAKHTEAEAKASEEELDDLAVELEQIQSRIRQTSPQYAALTQPVPLDVKDIQTSVLDKDTVLLEYALGEKKSFLWAVSSASVDIFELPPRAEIEPAAKLVYELLTARNQRPRNETPAARAVRVRQADEAFLMSAKEVSNMLLGPAAARIGNKRLLIVGEGVLQYLPFGALPAPGPATTGRELPSPLIASHEIITIPSASVVAVLRRETIDRKQAPKTLAVLADPVFNANDPRVAQQKNKTSAAAQERTPAYAIRSATDLGFPDFVRLRFSRDEAEQIARLAPGIETLKALDFDASRDNVLATDLGQYRILHFATHSLLNNEHPELSGVVLSLVDRSGHPQNGFLRLYDIYNLRLGSDLVVLSACQTALGREIRGEGLIGLTRGFLYAGARRVVASLWQIDDRTSAELMSQFYERMLVQGERPAAALRAAQIAMWRTKGWEAPYYWAAFTLQGEWR